MIVKPASPGRLVDAKMRIVVVVQDELAVGLFGRN